MATVSVFNDQPLFTDSGAGDIYSVDTITSLLSGRWHWQVARTSNAVGDFPGSGFPQFIGPLNLMYTFGMLPMLWPVGMALPVLPPGNLNTLSQGILLPGAMTGTDQFTGVYGPADIAASNPIGTGPWNLWYRIADNNLADNVPSEAIAATTTVCHAPRTTIIVSASQKCTVQPIPQSILVTWTADDLATGYHLTKDGVVVATLGGALSYADGANVGETHTYSVQAFNTCGTGISSNTASATVVGWTRDCGGGDSTMTRNCGGGSGTMTKSADPGASTMTRSCGGCQ